MGEGAWDGRDECWQLPRKEIPGNSSALLFGVCFGDTNSIKCLLAGVCSSTSLCLSSVWKMVIAMEFTSLGLFKA